MVLLSKHQGSRSFCFIVCHPLFMTSKTNDHHSCQCKCRMKKKAKEEKSQTFIYLKAKIKRLNFFSYLTGTEKLVCLTTFWRYKIVVCNKMF